MSDIKAIFSGGATWPELKWVVTDSLPATEPPASGFPVPDLADVAFLQYTSGTSSLNRDCLFYTRSVERYGYPWLVRMKSLDAVDKQTWVRSKTTAAGHGVPR